VTVGQEVGSASGDVTGLQVGRLVGDVAIDTINQIQARIIGGPEAADWLRQSRSDDDLRELARQITEATTGMLMAVQFVEMRSATYTQAEYDDAYLTWETRRAVIGAAIQVARLPPDVLAAWQTHSETLTHVYALSGVWDVAGRERLLAAVGEYLGTDLADLALLAEEPQRRSEPAAGRTYMAAWGRLKDGMLTRRDKLIEQLLSPQPPKTTGEG